MAYERVRIVAVHERAKRSTGQIFRFLEVEVAQNQQAFINDEMVDVLVPEYQRYVGQEVLLSCSWGDRDGKPQLQLQSDSFPIPLPPSLTRYPAAAQPPPFPLSAAPLDDQKRDEPPSATKLPFAKAGG